MVGTRKGGWLFNADADRREWRVDGSHLPGHVVDHLVLDPREGRTLLAAAISARRVIPRSRGIQYPTSRR